MRYLAALVVFLMLLSGCNATQELKPVSQINPGIAEEGSLANSKLISDVIAGLQTILGSPISNSNVLKFIIQEPTGNAGSRSWREMWIVKTFNSESQFLLTFTESGLDAADFEITQMNKGSSNTNCPSNAAKFPIGETTSGNVISCMGKPVYEDYNPDGRFVYLYETSQKVVLTYLFGKDKKLLKITVFKQTKN